ncbi:hypothetical protein BaRGS_00006788 [Batillaria attramentaria]|uniref:AIG1-type G domain-containing protein n=1 Tax=Batillaria attramentaria TaxID=370345 RepID=A0ABD0LSB0_9CAEN
MVKGKHESVESATPVRVLPLVGRTGTGKSSLDNAVLGKNVFSVGWPSESMTKASQTASNDEMEQKNRTYHEMKRLFGDDISRCMVVVFTRLDSEGEHFGYDWHNMFNLTFRPLLLQFVLD